MGRTPIQEYYARRAPEHDLVYEKPERQADLESLRSLLGELLAGHDVLELACGTGYWTQVIAGTARSVVGVDVNPEVLSLAKLRLDPVRSVSFTIADATRPTDIEGEFTAALATFWWSHVPIRDLPVFLDDLRRRLGEGARLVFVDNRYVDGSSTPIEERDSSGNSYQMRTLEDGSRHRVLKNFPEPREIRAALAEVGAGVELKLLDHYWCAWCTTVGSEGQK